MARPKNKKLADKFEVMSFAVNFCAVFALILVVGLLMAVQNIPGRQAGMAALSQSGISQSECVCDDVSCPLAVPAVLFPVSAGEPVESAARISMDDGGFLTKELDLALSSSRTLEIYNKGVRAHSFVIPELKIDTGAIIPGETKTVILENIPQDKEVLQFYSDLPNDAREKFLGTIVIR